MRLEQLLKETYEKNGIVLILGAGVSHKSGIPNWENLLCGLIDNRLKASGSKLLPQLREEGLSLPAVASLLEECYDSRLDFVEGVREALYKNFNFLKYGRRRVIDKRNRRQFVNLVQTGSIWHGRRNENPLQRKERLEQSNQTLRAVGAVCAVRRKVTTKKGTQLRYFANPRIRAIVTLNLDALLQTYVYALTTKHLVRTIEGPSAKFYPDRVSLYHMHGYLHFDPRQEDRRIDAPESVVLTEQDYYDFFNQPNSMFNYTFLHLLRECSCLFIGLSMEDENIRRLMHYSKTERMKAEAMKKGIPMEALQKRKVSPKDEQEIRKEVRRHFVIMKRSNSAQVDDAKEKTLQPLGAHVLWVKDFDEIPRLLKRLYRSVRQDGPNWKDVFGPEA